MGDLAGRLPPTNGAVTTEIRRLVAGDSRRLALEERHAESCWRLLVAVNSENGNMNDNQEAWFLCSKEVNKQAECSTKHASPCLYKTRRGPPMLDDNKAGGAQLWCGSSGTLKCLGVL